MSDTAVVHELFFSSSGGTEEDLALSDDESKKVIWKDILREGQFAMTPAGGGTIRRKPFKVIASGDSDASKRIISMSDIMEAHRDKAFEHVTIPTRHSDELLENTGFVPQPSGLRIVKRGDTHFMQAALGFTEPDIAGKVRRGTIPNVSSGVFFDFVRKADAKKFRCALKHVCLTHTPFINNLTPFKAVFASDEEIEGDPSFETYQFADSAGDNVDAGGASDDTTKGDIVWNERDGMNWLREEIQQSLNPQEQPVDDGRPYVAKPYYFVRDASDIRKRALVEESFKGDRKVFVVPFERDGEKVKISPETRWTESREAMVAASDDNFAEMMPGSIREKLTIALNDMAGDKFSIGDVALDNRVRISTDEKAWVAGFTAFADGSVFLDDPALWTRVPKDGTSAPPKKDAPRPASKPGNMVTMSDALGSSVQAARQRRRRLMGAARQSR